MSPLTLASLIATAAALFGWLSVRVLRLPITIGTMLLTVIASVASLLVGSRVPGLHPAVVAIVQRIHFGDVVLHGMLGLLLFAGSFLLDLGDLAREKLSVSVLAIGGTIASMAAVAAVMHLG